VELLEANELALTELGSDEAIAGTVEKGVHLHGSVVVEDGALVRSGAYIEGPGANPRGCRGWPECVSSRIDGDRSRRARRPRRRSENSVLMADASVGHLSYVGDSVLGRGVNFGAGRTSQTSGMMIQPSA